MAGKQVARRPAAPPPRTVQGKVISRRTAPPPRPRPPRPPRPAPPPRAPRQAPGPKPAAGRRVTERGPQPVTIRVQPPGAYTASRMLTAELAVGILIVAVRTVADYEPQADGTLKGKVGHPKGQYGPLPVLAGLIVSFFLLSFLAAGGGLKAKLAVIAGGIIDLALLMKSSAEFEKVTGTFGTFGKAKLPPGAWQTEGTAAGEPISGTLPSGGGGSGSSGGGGSKKAGPPGTIPVPPSGVCPAGYLKGGESASGPFWCTPITEG